MKILCYITLYSALWYILLYLIMCYSIGCFFLYVLIQCYFSFVFFKFAFFFWASFFISYVNSFSFFLWKLWFFLYSFLTPFPPVFLSFLRSLFLSFNLSLLLSFSLSLSAGRRGGSAPPGSLSLSPFVSLSLSIALNSLIVLDAYLSFLDAYLIFCRCVFNFFKAYPHPVRNLLNPETPKSSTAYLASWNPGMLRMPVVLSPRKAQKQSGVM